MILLFPECAPHSMTNQTREDTEKSDIIDSVWQDIFARKIVTHPNYEKEITVPRIPRLISRRKPHGSIQLKYTKMSFSIC